MTREKLLVILLIPNYDIIWIIHESRLLVSQYEILVYV